jgi:hypothetical protein
MWLMTKQKKVNISLSAVLKEVVWTETLLTYKNKSSDQLFSMRSCRTPPENTSQMLTVTDMWFERSRLGDGLSAIYNFFFICPFKIVLVSTLT